MTLPLSSHELQLNVVPTPALFSLLHSFLYTLWFMNDYHVSLRLILLKLTVSFLYVLKDVSYEQHTQLCRLLCLELSCQSSAQQKMTLCYSH